MIHLEAREIARHRRSYVPADVVIDPDHARALRLAREARHLLQGGDVEIPTIDLSRYDALVGVGSAGASVQGASENGSAGLLKDRLEAKAAR